MKKHKHNRPPDGHCQLLYAPQADSSSVARQKQKLSIKKLAACDTHKHTDELIQLGYCGLGIVFYCYYFHFYLKWWNNRRWDKTVNLLFAFIVCNIVTRVF